MKRVLLFALLAAVMIFAACSSNPNVSPTTQQGKITVQQLDFHSSWIYNSPGDVFTNQQVIGERKWFAAIVESTEPVLGARLNLASSLALDWVYPEPQVLGSSTYDWSFGDVSKAKVGVGSSGLPVTFSPGFDASRTIIGNKTVFLQSQGTQTQTLKIAVTPKDSTAVDMRVQALENELVNPVITSPTTDDSLGIWLSPDGHDLQIYPPDLVLNTERVFTITIDVTPKASQLKYIPFVEVHLRDLETFAEKTGNSFSHEVPGLGTWTWSTLSNRNWHLRDGIVREVHWAAQT